MHSQTTVKHEVFDVTISDAGQQNPYVGDDMQVRVKAQFKPEFRYESETHFGPRCRILGYSVDPCVWVQPTSKDDNPWVDGIFSAPTWAEARALALDAITADLAAFDKLRADRAEALKNA